MRIATLHPAKRSRWMDWKLTAQISANCVEREPTKPPKRGCVGFEGAILAESPEIKAEPDPSELVCASGVLNRAGVGIMWLESELTIGLWSDLDGPEVRAALRTFGWSGYPSVIWMGPLFR